MENTSVNSNNDILTIKKLSKIYHTNKSEIPAIKDLNLNIKEGEFVAIVGPSGCGKTTLLSILCSLEEKSQGEIIYTQGKQKMGYMLQNDTLFPWLNILDNTLLGLKIEKNITKENIQKVTRLLHKKISKQFIRRNETKSSANKNISNKSRYTTARRALLCFRLSNPPSSIR